MLRNQRQIVQLMRSVEGTLRVIAIVIEKLLSRIIIHEMKRQDTTTHDDRMNTVTVSKTRNLHIHAIFPLPPNNGLRKTKAINTILKGTQHQRHRFAAYCGALCIRNSLGNFAQISFNHHASAAGKIKPELDSLGLSPFHLQDGFPVRLLHQRSRVKNKTLLAFYGECRNECRSGPARRGRSARIRKILARSGNKRCITR